MSFKIDTIKEAKPLKAGVWYTISNFLVKGMVFLTTPIFTRIMSSSDIGLFSNLSTWVSLLTILFTFELASSISIARFDFKSELKQYISSNLVLGIIITGFFYIVALFFHNFFEDLLSCDFETLNLIFLYLLFYPAMQMFQLENQIKYRFIPIVIVSIGSTIIATCFSLAGVCLFEDQLKGRIFGYYIPLIFFNFIIFIYLVIRGKNVSFKHWKYGLKISFPLIFHLLASYILSASDRLMITRLVGSEATAFYSVAYSCGMIISLLWTSLNNAWSPWAYQKMEEKDFGSLKEKSKIYTLFFSLITIMFLLVGPELLLLMGGQKYLEAVYVIPAVGAGFSFQFLYSFFVNIEFYNKKQILISIGTIIAAVINIMLNLIFIPLFGYIAAAFTTLAGYICLFLIHLAFVYFMKKTKWYDVSFFITFGFGILLFSFLMLFLYQYTILRYALIAALIIFVSILILLKKEQLLKYIKRPAK